MFVLCSVVEVYRNVHYELRVLSNWVGIDGKLEEAHPMFISSYSMLAKVTEHFRALQNAYSTTLALTLWIYF